MDDLVEVIEIWQPVDEGGEVISVHEGRSQPMKLVAYLVGGRPIKLEEDWMLEIRHITITKEEAARIHPLPDSKK